MKVTLLRGKLTFLARTFARPLYTVAGLRNATVPEMLPRFLKAKTAADQTLWLQEAKYPCSTCCNDGPPDL